MTYAPITHFEERCWSLAAAGASIVEIAERLDVTRDHAQWGLYGAAAAMVREWQRRQSRAFLKRLYKRGRRPE